MRTEIIVIDNAIQSIINTLQSDKCGIKCKVTVVQFLEAAIGELDAELEGVTEDASS